MRIGLGDGAAYLFAKRVWNGYDERTSTTHAPERHQKWCRISYGLCNLFNSTDVRVRIMRELVFHLLIRIYTCVYKL